MLALLLPIAPLACFEDPVASDTGTNTGATETGDGDAGDGDGDAGDGDGDAGDGDGDTGDGDGDTGDGDGDMGDGDGDGDEPGACESGPYQVGYNDPIMLDAGQNPQGSAVGDLDGDGYLDIVAGSYAESTLRAWLGNGDGSFQDPVISVTGGGAPSQIYGGAIADGVFDVVARVFSNNEYGFARLRGDGSGGFYDVETVDLPGFNLALGRITGDAALDVVTGSMQELSVFPASVGQESYFPADPIVSASPLGGIDALVTGDFDGDEDMDLAAATFGGLFIATNNGAGEFTFDPTPKEFFGGPSDIAVGDVDGDGALDIVLTTFGGGSDAGHLFWGVGDGSFEDDVEIPAPSTPRALDVKDIDKDGLADVAMIGIGTVAVSLSTGEGFGPSQQKSCEGLNPRQLDLGDFNGDCVDDVAATTDDGVCVVLSLL